MVTKIHAGEMVGDKAVYSFVGPELLEIGTRVHVISVHCMYKITSALEQAQNIDPNNSHLNAAIDRLNELEKEIFG